MEPRAWDVIVRWGGFAERLPWMFELEINRLIIGPGGVETTCNPDGAAHR
jgi:hypothetical protein